MHREINAGLADPKIKALLADLGGDVLALLPAGFGELNPVRRSIHRVQVKEEKCAALPPRYCPKVIEP